ncbi:hypothetical protein RBV54_004805 [Salmonella enterica]|nr:hypothetical protein [Salmonella enterica]ELF7042534.1 hypothetical protein [Salmonella enterica]
MKKNNLHDLILKTLHLHSVMINYFTKKSRKRGSAAAKDCSGLLLCNTVTANSSLVSDFPCAGVINKDFSSCK